MKPIILKNILFTLLVVWCLPGYCDENDSTARTYAMPEIIVETTHASSNHHAYKLLTTITKEDIGEKGVHTVEDVLRYIPGVDVRTRGVGGGQTDISLRGSTFDQVAIMINGVNISDVQTGHYSMNLPVDMALVERIEVLRGGGSEIFGGNALAGAINIITTDDYDYGYDNKYNADLSGGMYGYVAADFAGRNNREKHNFAYSANYSQSKGYSAPDATEKEATAMKNSDYRIANLWFQSAFMLCRDAACHVTQEYHRIDLQLGAQYKDIGAGMFYGFGSQDQFDATRTAFGSLKYTGSWNNWKLEAHASYRANYDRYEWHRGQRKYGNFHFGQNIAASVKGSYAYRIGKTTVGIEVRDNNIHSTNLGDTINPDGQVPNVEGFDLKDVRVLDLVKGANRFDISWFASQTFMYGNFSANLSINGLWNTLTPCRDGACSVFNNLGGGANFGYQYLSASFVYLNISRTYRLPTFTDLYYDAGNQLGDRNLKAEKAWTFLAGANYQANFDEAGKLKTEISTYYRLGENIIDWVYVPEDTKRPFHAQNLDGINTFGIELSALYKWNEWLKNVGLSYAYTYMDLGKYAESSRYLDYLSHKAVLQIEHRIAKIKGRDAAHHVSDSEFGASWVLTYQKREGYYNDPDGNVCRYAGVLLLDGNIYWSNRTFKVSAECTNITNRRYYDYGGVLRPGIWANLRFSVKI